MNTDPVRLTREELYEQVWSEPMSRLAERYGPSDEPRKDLGYRRGVAAQPGWGPVATVVFDPNIDDE